MQVGTGDVSLRCSKFYLFFYFVSKSLSLERCSGDSTSWIPEQPDGLKGPPEVLSLPT